VGYGAALIGIIYRFSGQPIGPIFNDQAVQEEIVLGLLIFVPKVGNYQ
jgi:hypothetical protein